MTVKRLTLLLVLFACILLAGCKRMSEAAGGTRLIPVASAAVHDSTSIYYLDFSDYCVGNMRDLPVGVFDSGTGGLNVVERLLTMDSFDNVNGSANPDGIPDLAGERFQYLDDEANMPYSTYVAESNEDYLRELVVKDALFLLGKKYYRSNVEDDPSGVKQPVKLIVVACNTASAYGMQDVANMLEEAGCGVKVIGVIESGVAAAVGGMRRGGSYAVGVMSNRATIASGIYGRILADSAAAIGCALKVVTKECTGLDEAIDRTSDSAAFLARRFFREMVDSYLASSPAVPLGAVILGSTHYPYLTGALEEELAILKNTRIDGRAIYREMIADNFKFIDPSEYTARECYSYLRENGLLALSVKASTLDSYISVPSYGLPAECLDSSGRMKYDYKYGRQVATGEVTVKQVPFSHLYIDFGNLSLFHERVPRACGLIVNNLKIE